VRALHALGHALALAGSMTWEILWALVLGFLLSSVVQAVVPRHGISRLLGSSGPRALATAGVLGAASSSCSYAAAALARALFRQGASFTAAMAFEIASTNLVFELGAVLAVLIGWQFTLAEFVAAPVMMAVVALEFRLVLSPRLLESARRQAERNLAGTMEGHAAMDMSVPGSHSWWRKLASGPGLTSVSHIFYMEWASVAREIAGGLLVAGAVAAWVPAGFWTHLFWVGHPLASKLWGPFVGPVVSMAAFVCSVGNVPLAAVLWNRGISFGGVASFVLADLVIVPLLVIYRRYYGTRVALVILGCFYLAMVVAGFVVEGVFRAAGLVPAVRHAKVAEVSVRLDYTTALNLAFLALSALLAVRFVRTGGPAMLTMMGEGAEHHGCHHDAR
jgi:uncharacterized membrane protein YraQ (UPF0718 family)